jgi:hypothetical protein
MKNVIVLFFVILISASISIFIKKVIDKQFLASISFDTRKFDFDTLLNQRDAEFYFVYRNSGKGDLRIFDIKTSCGCTIPSWNDGYLKSAEKDSFKVSYNIENKGFFLKEIMVYSNSESSPDRLEIMGYVPFE